MKTKHIILGILLIMSLALNVALAGMLLAKDSKNEEKSVENNITSTIPEELVGTWSAKGGRVVEIFEDGMVYWTYNTSGHIYTGYIGRLDGYSLLLSQKYEGNGQGNYQSMSEVPNEELKESHIIYDLTMHGTSAFSAQNVDPREYAWSFIKEE